MSIKEKPPDKKIFKCPAKLASIIEDSRNTNSKRGTQ